MFKFNETQKTVMLFIRLFMFLCKNIQVCFHKCNAFFIYFLN